MTDALSGDLAPQRRSGARPWSQASRLCADDWPPRWRRPNHPFLSSLAPLFSSLSKHATSADKRPEGDLTARMRRMTRYVRQGFANSAPGCYESRMFARAHHHQH